MLELQNVSYSVTENDTSDGSGASKEIIKNISLKIEDAFTAITGPNGGGKSTLAKLIAGIIRPTSGSILLDGQDITRMSITDRARAGISFAFQQPVRFKGLTVKDLIMLASGDRKMTVAGVCEYLSAVGLCAREYVKRLEIAMILARGPKLSVFDEPEAGIDLWSFNNLIKVFEQMHEKTSGSIIIISHQERILNIADRIIVIADGQVRKSGSREEVLEELLAADTGCKYYKGQEA